MITIDDFKNFVAKNPGATTSEIQKQLKLSRGRIHKISSSNPDSIKVVKDGRNSKHSINPEQLVFNEVSIVIDNSFPTKQLSIRQFDVTNTTPKAITDFRAFSCDDHEIFKKNIGPIYLNDKKINPEFVTVRKRTIRYMHSWESGNNTLTANYECLPSNYYLYDTAYPVQNLNLRLYLKIRTLKTPTLYRSPDMYKIAEMTYVERSGNFYYLEDQKLAPGGYELIW